MKIPIRDPHDRRKNERVPAGLKVEVILPDGRVFNGVLKDVSIDGIQVGLAEEEDLSEENVKVRVYLPDGGVLHLKGKMVWKQKIDGNILFGLTCLEISEKDREKFFEFLSEAFLRLFLSLVTNDGE